MRRLLALTCLVLVGCIGRPSSSPPAPATAVGESDWESTLADAAARYSESPTELAKIAAEESRLVTDRGFPTTAREWLTGAIACAARAKPTAEKRSVYAFGTRYIDARVYGAKTHQDAIATIALD